MEPPIVAIIVVNYSRPAWTLTSLLVGFRSDVHPHGAGQRTMTALINLQRWGDVPAGTALSDPLNPAGRSVGLALTYLRRRAQQVQLIVRPAEADRVGDVRTLSPAALVRAFPDLSLAPGGVLVEVAAS
jgi:hypothetical protein